MVDQFSGEEWDLRSSENEDQDEYEESFNVKEIEMMLDLNKRGSESAKEISKIFKTK